MGDITKNLININLPDLPPSVDSIIKNATDKPSLSVGATFSDLWDLVFGGVSYLAGI